MMSTRSRPVHRRVGGGPILRRADKSSVRLSVSIVEVWIVFSSFRSSRPPRVRIFVASLALAADKHARKVPSSS
jgi:hypothetical protein